MVPFLFRFAQRLPETKPQRLRYDEVRQISQVLEGEVWIDVCADCESTLFTRVAQETTDDN
jgi:hypothetical protein